MQLKAEKRYISRTTSSGTDRFAQYRIRSPKARDADIFLQ
jgi:hypothetical protein